MTCGLGALIEFVEPTITVRVKGAVAEIPPTVSCAPLGFEAKMRTTVLGLRRTVTLAVLPSESRTVCVRSK